MKLNLSIWDRLYVGELYPQQSNIQSQLLMQDINGIVKLSDAERDEVGFALVDSGGFRLNPVIAKSRMKKLEMTATEVNFLKTRVTELDNTNKVTPNILDLCLKIQDAKMDEEEGEKKKKQKKKGPDNGEGSAD